jgi:hypothetical protein
MRISRLLILAGAVATLGWSQAPELTTREAVLEKYQQALGGVEAIRKVQSETRHGEVEAPGMKVKLIVVLAPVGGAVKAVTTMALEIGNAGELEPAEIVRLTFPPRKPTVKAINPRSPPLPR